MRALRSRFDNRFTTVVAAAAVIGLVGGGVGYAAGTITSADIKDDSVKSIDIKDKTLKLEDISKKAQKELAGEPGPAGPAGPQGPAGPAGDGAVTVGVLGSTQDFDATNASVSLTPDGVEFGPYANGGASGGSICTKVLNGETLADVENLAFNARYVSEGDTGGVGVPYLRLFLNDGSADHSAIFAPNTQSPDPDIAEGPFHEWVATQGSWRYDDDAGNGPDISWAQLVAAHGTDEITGDICITVGFTNGTDLAGLLRWWDINGTRYVFEG